jgi:hypothetical protein
MILPDKSACGHFPPLGAGRHFAANAADLQQNASPPDPGDTGSRSRRLNSRITVT